MPLSPRGSPRSWSASWRWPISSYVGDIALGEGVAVGIGRFPDGAGFALAGPSSKASDPPPKLN
eukprot:715527-Pyramimonas_sp.AAC.1